ncbi:MAG: efflux RND transporter periplasmic adaptor subunit [Hyphomicrobiales bacterium]
MKRSIFIAVAVCAALAVAFFVFRPGSSKPDDANVMTAPAQIGTVEESVLARGILKPAALVAVGAQVSGRITSLNVAVGDAVKKGDPIAEIDPTAKENALCKAQADIKRIKAERKEKEAVLAYQRSELDRQKYTLKQNASSQSTYDEALEQVNITLAQIDSFDAQIAKAELAMDQARIELGYTKIIAPMDGTVLSIVTQEGQTINASQTAPTIVVLGQTDVMTMLMEISEVDILKVKLGQKVYFTMTGESDHRYDASLESIEPAPESIRNDRDVDPEGTTLSSLSKAIYYNGAFNIPNPDGRLRSYMTAEIHIIVAEAKDVLTIPSQALSKNEQNGVYVVEVVGADNRIERRKVTVGLNNRVTAQILSGLKRGEKVAVGKIKTKNRRRWFMGF